jgi:carboxymethylenebutenolidase
MTDPLIVAEDVSFAGPASQVKGHLARPRAEGTYPGIIVIHENQGLTEHIKDVARRYGREGFAALAVDMVSRFGGTDPNDPNRTMMANRSSAEDLTADLVAGVNHLKAQRFVKANAIGVTGFCMGGSFVWNLAIASPDIKAAVPYYGSIADIEKLSQTRAAVLGIYAETDTRITGQAAEVEAKLKSLGRPVEIKIYPGAAHAFFNDTGQRYHEASAKDAWVQTLAWFRKHLV